MKPQILNLINSYKYKEEIIEGVKKDWFPLFVKYPVSPEPRYSIEKPHPFLNDLFISKKEDFRKLIESLAKFREEIKNIPAHSDDPRQPFWVNDWFSGLDALFLYCLLSERKPNQYVEIGSGFSTKFARLAILNNNLNTKITSIDPEPRTEINNLADTVIRKKLEDYDLDVFDNIKENDIIFFDGSHRIFMNSDVTVFFMDVMPKLPKGTLIHIHDIHLPYDYPMDRKFHWESEQYLLSAMFLTNQTSYSVLLPNEFIAKNKDLADFVADSFKLEGDLINVERGNSFWMIKN